MLIINKASAGSGKTYNLVYEFIIMLLGYKPNDSKQSEYKLKTKLNNEHSKILAITFTNKATEEMKQRIHILEEAFLPIDTFRFRTRLATERHLEDILAIKVEHVLKEYYGIDLSTVTDELVKKAAMLMPYLNKRRGDVRYVKRILETIAGHKVRMRQSAYSDTDNSRYWIQKVDFDIHVDGLDTESYRKEETRLKPLTEFLSEYFIPVDIICNFNIVGKNKENKLLNYNSNVL